MGKIIEFEQEWNLYVLRSLNMLFRSFLILFSDDSSLLDLNFFDVLSESVFDGLDDIRLVSLEGVEVSSPSDFEFGDFSVLFNENSYIECNSTFLSSFDLAFIAALLLLQESEELLYVFDLLRLKIGNELPLACGL
jgi:hypothetical protein